MMKRGYFIFLVPAGIVLLFFLSLSARQTDPFYLNVLEKAQKSFLARSYQEAAHDFEIAAFGLMGNKRLQAKAKVYLSLCRYYQNDLAAAEKSLREATGLMGDQGFSSLEIYESTWPDLDKMISFFNLARPQNQALPQEVEKPLPANPESQSASPGQPAKRPEENRDISTAKEAETDTALAPPPVDLKINELKEGDLVALDLVETRPTLIKKIPAVYPEHSRSRGIEGTVLINALISEKGKVVKTEIIQGIKNAVGFDQAALKAVRQWKFEPASIKGIKVKVWIPVAIEFKRSLSLPE
ncbi:MAG: energy transducer TonB [Candidatus Aminicenantales bacterium]